MDSIAGMGVALVTPLNNEGQIDWQANERLLEHVITGGADFLVVLGTTGEASMLSETEKDQLVRFAIERCADRLPVVVGVGGNNTLEVAGRLRSMNSKGVDAILSVCPYYVRPTQEGLYRHFMELAAVSPKPLILYNVPSRTGVNLTASTALRLARDAQGVIAIKDATTDLQQLHELISARPDGFKVLSGDDATALPAVLGGADGVISVIGQALPGLYGRMIQFGRQHQSDRAYALFKALNPLIQAIYKEGNPAGVKALLERLGLTGPQVRLPLVPATEALTQEIKGLLDKLREQPLWAGESV